MLGTSSVVALQHHERLDGSGYLGLQDAEIHPHAKIVAVADVFDALISPRPYKRPWDIPVSYTHLKAAARLEFVQDYIPLKEIRNGIVETTDGRYLKILEIEPINFLLRSNEEQWGIISTFASWLKISPMRLQFKSVTRKADSDKYVAGLEADIESEDVTACRELGRGTIQFIREEGSREALSRRFFLIFQYEAVRRDVYKRQVQSISRIPVCQQMRCGRHVAKPVGAGDRPLGDYHLPRRSCPHSAQDRLLMVSDFDGGGRWVAPTPFEVTKAC